MDFIDSIKMPTCIIFISLTYLMAFMETINFVEFISFVHLTRHDSATHKLDLQHLIVIITINELG